MPDVKDYWRLIMFWFWFWVVVMCFSPSIGAVALVAISPRPDMLTAMCGTSMGLVVATCIFFLVT